MSLTLEEVKEIGKLARLQLTEDEAKRFQGQLSAILDYAAQLQQLDTSNVPPTAQVTGLVGIMREDVVEGSLPQQEALANAQASREGFVVVPTVLEES